MKKVLISAVLVGALAVGGSGIAAAQSDRSTARGSETPFGHTLGLPHDHQNPALRPPSERELALTVSEDGSVQFVINMSFAFVPCDDDAVASSRSDSDTKPCAVERPEQGAAQMDGAILVVSAADGPMP